MKSLLLAGVFLLCAAPSTFLQAQQWDSATVREVAPGIVHRRLVVNKGPWRLNVVEVDLRAPGVSVRGMRANDAFRTRETVRSMAGRYKGPGSVIAAVNGDFFNIRTGESENNVVIEGDVLKGVRITDSPYDTYNNLHSQFGVDWKNKPFIDRFGLDGTVTARGRSARLDGINFRQDSNSLVLYTRALGDSASVDTLGRDFSWVPLKLVAHNGNTLTYRVNGSLKRGGWMQLANGASLAAGGKSRGYLESVVRNGGVVRIVRKLSPDRGNIRTVVGGWPRLIRGGKVDAGDADILEGTFPRFSSTRHPRTAIGFSRDSTKLILMTVDGRRESDSGMSLVELGEAMLSVGAFEAMAFDGGGSTTMLVQGEVMNHPSDATGERAVGSALLIVLER
jgi:exopolysaccharide biosynthesis protein